MHDGDACDACDDRKSARAWYREPWPWLLMAGPAIVVVAGLFTAAIAFRSSDGVVADDYYKRGLAVNQELRRDHEASAAGLRATLRIESDRVLVELSGDVRMPDTVRLSIVHPTRAGQDQFIELRAQAPGVFSGPLKPFAPGTRRLLIEDPGGVWRLTGSLAGGASQAVLSAAP